ncbi:MAG TPA: hypothetical protein VKA89_11505 [Solirubrobacterales bacterium]|nr:hypothetical protein [Solirubrobacterales bacterium]
MDIGTILGLIVIGLIVGVLARLAVPGRNPIGFLGTILVGIAGALGAGLLMEYVVDSDSGGLAFLLAVAVAALLVWLISRPRGLRY